MDEKCMEVRLLLPWVVSGKLDVHEKVIALGHLAECAYCRKELSFMFNLQKASVSGQDAQMGAEEAQALLGSMKSIIKTEMVKPEAEPKTGLGLTAAILKSAGNALVLPFGPTVKEVKTYLNLMGSLLSMKTEPVKP